MRRPQRTDQFEIDLSAYAEIRYRPSSSSGPGTISETETVVARNDVYWTVRKDEGIPAEIARATDPNG